MLFLVMHHLDVFRFSALLTTMHIANTRVAIYSSAQFKKVAFEVHDLKKNPIDRSQPQDLKCLTNKYLINSHCIHLESGVSFTMFSI